MDYVNEDKLMKEAQEVWKKYFKKIMSWDSYWPQIRDQVKIYHALPDKEKHKFTQVLMNRVHRTERAINNIKIERKIK